MKGVEVPQAPRGVGRGRGYTAGRVCVGGWLCPLSRKFFIFFVENTIF